MKRYIEPIHSKYSLKTTQKPIGLKMGIFLSVIEVLYTLAFKTCRKVWKPWHHFPSFSSRGIIKYKYPIKYRVVMAGKTEKVNPRITKCKYAFNGLSFNVYDAETITLVYKLIGVPLCLLYLALIFPSEVLFAWF